MSIVVEEATGGVEQVTENQETIAAEAIEAVEAPVETQDEVATEPESIIPEKYAGKTLEEVIEMHQNAEKALGKQGQEVGHQRKLIEQLMSDRQTAETTTEPTEEPVNFEDNFYADPEKAINAAIENNPELKALKEAKIQAEQSANTAKLEAAHPDYKEVLDDANFQKWVQGSEIRLQLLLKAHNKFDFAAANELLGTWKQISMIDKTRETEKEQEKTRKSALRKTSSETRSSGDSVGGKKIYRRSDLIELQVRDPARYQQMSPEIDAAYAEGRVK